MKRQQSVVLDKLRRQRRVAARQISKIIGSRDLIDHSFIEGDTWWACSDGWDFDMRLEQVKEQEELAKLSPDERNHRALLKRGWRLVEGPTRA